MEGLESWRIGELERWWLLGVEVWVTSWGDPWEIFGKAWALQLSKVTKLAPFRL